MISLEIKIFNSSPGNHYAEQFWGFSAPSTHGPTHEGLIRWAGSDLLGSTKYWCYGGQMVPRTAFEKNKKNFTLFENYTISFLAEYKCLFLFFFFLSIFYHTLVSFTWESRNNVLIKLKNDNIIWLINQMYRAAYSQMGPYVRFSSGAMKWKEPSLLIFKTTKYHLTSSLISNKIHKMRLIFRSGAHQLRNLLKHEMHQSCNLHSAWSV